ncbi:MAG: hypothetical protein ABIR96_12685 [Bdellovibrionota bacterium]
MFGKTQQAMRAWEYRLKKIIWIVGFFAALSLKAGSFLGKGDIVRPSRVGEQASPADDAGLPQETLVNPAQHPAGSLADHVDPNFKGNRTVGERPPYRLQLTTIKDEYILQEVDPEGPYKHLKDKVGKHVSGEELGLPSN